MYVAPDRFRKEIEKEGYDRWLRGFETPAEWERRVRVADEIIAGALNAAKNLINRRLISVTILSAG